MKYQSAIISFFSFIPTSLIGFLTNLPSYLRPKNLHKNIAYGDEAWQNLDVYSPKTKKKNLPVIIFFYGGGWRSGKKEDYRFVADFFIANGYTIVIPDYVKYPQGAFPDFIHDGAKAAKWVQSNISQYNGDAQNINLVGFSAGAHLGALLHYNKEYLLGHGFDYNNIKSFIGVSGAYNFIPHRKTLKLIFASDKDGQQMRVPNFVSGDESKVLLLHGEKDETVPAESSQKMAADIAAKGGNVKIILYKSLTHLGLLGCFASIFSSRSQVKKDMLDFLKSSEAVS